MSGNEIGGEGCERWSKGNCGDRPLQIMFLLCRSLSLSHNLEGGGCWWLEKIVKRYEGRSSSFDAGTCSKKPGPGGSR
jgi:hypothetical protein